MPVLSAVALEEQIVIHLPFQNSNFIIISTKNLSLDAAMNLLHILVPCLFKIYFNTIGDIQSCPFLYMH
jgi:hypothetical protein